MVAISTISGDKQLSRYYQRKAGEEKNRMFVLNALGNKILHRLCAVTKRDTPYEKDYRPVYQFA